MPWKIVKNGDQFCVIKESDGTTEKCHPTKAEAEAHMAALYANEGKAISKRPDVNPKEGVNQYGDVTFADEKNKKYPIDTEEHIRAAWSYINKSENASKYSPEEVATIKRKIIAAWKDKIDKAGPPGAGKSVDPDETKIGRVISAATMGKIQAAHDTLSELGAACKQTKEMVDVVVDVEKSVITYGGTVKALPDNKVGGYLVTFGGVDLVGDYFTKETDFGEYSRLPVLYHHGFDEKLKTRRIGTAEVNQDEVGLWAEAQLSMRDEYEKMVYELAKNGKLGWSSGAAAHVAKREEDAKGSKITQWYMAEASLTPCPAEPHNSVIPLKSLMSASQTEIQPKQEAEAAQPAQKAEEQVEVNLQGVNTMELTPEQLQEMIDKSANSAIKAYVAAQPSVKPPEVEVVTDEADNALKGGFTHPGEFFMAVKNAAIRPGRIDKRLLPLEDSETKATGAGEAIPSAGGFLVEQSIAAGIFEKMHPTGSLLSLFTPDGIGPNSNGMTYNVVDETSRADGSRWGGVRGYWMAEAGTKTASHPAFRQLELKLKKCAALCYSTDELLEDSAALGSWIMRTAPQELRFMVEDSVINGSGAGKPLGIFKSSAYIEEPPASAAPTIVSADILAVWARRFIGVTDYVWLVDPTLVPALAGLTIGNFPVYLPSGSLRGALEGGTMLGRPVMEVEYLPDANATTGPVGLLLMSPSQYQIIDKGGVQSASSIHVNFINDETAFRFVYRLDGAPIWQSALTPYSGGETVSPFVALGSTSS